MARALCAVVSCCALLSCSAWDRLDNRERGAIIGGAGGAAVGSAVGDTPGALIGGAAGVLGGGVIGNEMDKDDRDRRRDRVDY